MTMRPPALLELLGRLLAEHRARDASGGLAVVPVVLLGDFEEVDEADPPVQRLLAAFARYSDAAYADASEAAAGAPGELVDDVVLRGALGGALTIERPVGTSPLTFTDGDVTLGSTDIDVASDGERELIGLARSLLDPRWRQHQIGLLTYTERNMDKPSARASWAAVTTALATPGVPLGQLRTLVVLVRAPRLHYDIHLTGEPSTRFVLDGERLVPRGSATRVRDFSADLARIDGTVVLHLGAGFSHSSNLPLGDELRDAALRRRYEASRDAPVRPLALRLYRDGQRDGALSGSERAAGEQTFADELTLEQVVRLEATLYSGTPQALQDFALRHGRASPGPAVQALARVVGGLRRLVLVTVNFDELIEQAAGERVRVFALDDAIAEFPGYLQLYLDGREPAVPLLKLHGTISTPESCVVNAEQIDAGLPPHKREALQAIAKTAHTGAPWVYIGASLRDVDITPVLDDDLFREQVEECWVMPMRDASIERFAERLRTRAWRAGQRKELDERTLSTSADDFLVRLAGQVEALGGQ